MKRAARRGFRIIAVVVTAATTSCGSGGGHTQRPTAPTEASVHALRAHFSGAVAVSPVIADGAGQAVALAVMKQLQSPAIPQVLLYRWERTAWKRADTFVLDVGGSVAADNGTATPITTADLTSAAEPELLVTVHYNAGPATAVLSKYGGSWHPLVFHGGVTRAGDERFDVHVRGNTLTSRENDCLPNCAQGHPRTTIFRFNPATGRLDAVRR